MHGHIFCSCYGVMCHHTVSCRCPASGVSLCSKLTMTASSLSSSIFLIANDVCKPERTSLGMNYAGL